MDTFVLLMETENMTATRHLPSGAAISFTPAVMAGPEKRPAVLLVHGWKSTPFSGASYELIREKLSAAGMHVYTLSLCGHEGTEGDPTMFTRADHQNDVSEAYVALLRGELASGYSIDFDRIGALGVSYGGYLLATLLPSINVKAFAMRAPASYPDEGWDIAPQDTIDRIELAAWRQMPHEAPETLALDGVAGYHDDLLIIASGDDELIPPAVTDSYLDAAALARSKKLVVLEGAAHTLGEDEREKFLAVLVPWFESHL